MTLFGKSKSMKKHLVALVLSVVGLKAEIEFAGFFLTTAEARFVLADTKSGRSSGWLKAGDSFAGATVLSYDQKSEALTVRMSGREVQLALRKSKVKDGKSTVTGRISFQNSQVEGVVASLFLDEETEFPIREGVKLRIKPERRPDGAILYRSWFDIRNSDGMEETINCPAIVARSGVSFGMWMGDMGYSFKP